LKSHVSIYKHARTSYSKPPQTTNTHPFQNEQKDGKKISPWHDIPLKAEGQTFNFITEIPKL
jgi:hypothetical protein